jgi:hypothetical protein
MENAALSILDPQSIGRKALTLDHTVGVECLQEETPRNSQPRTRTGSCAIRKNAGRGGVCESSDF